MSDSKSQARRIVEDGFDIRRRIESLTTRLLKGGLDQKALGDELQEILSGVREGLESAMPKDRGSALRQVMDGLSDSFAAAADAVRQAAEHAQERGRAFAKDDLSRLANKLQSLEHSFFDSVAKASEKLGEQARAEWRDIVRQARSAGTRIAPAARAAAEAVQTRAGDVAREAVDSAGKAARLLLSDAALGLAGLLSGIGKIVEPKPPAKPASRKTGTRKAPARKAAPARAGRIKARAGASRTATARPRAKKKARR